MGMWVWRRLCWCCYITGACRFGSHLENYVKKGTGGGSQAIALRRDIHRKRIRQLVCVCKRGVHVLSRKHGLRGGGRFNGYVNHVGSGSGVWIIKKVKPQVTFSVTQLCRFRFVSTSWLSFRSKDPLFLLLLSFVAELFRWVSYFNLLGFSHIVSNQGNNVKFFLIL